MTKEEEKFISTLHLQRGITKRQIGQLIFETLTDPEIRRWTSDRRKRFYSLESFAKWHQKGKTIYVLTDESHNLFGIIWFGKRELPKENYLYELDTDRFENTFAIRLYSVARGKGIAEKFVVDALQNFRLNSKGGIWLETGIQNAAALHLYQKTGWLQITYPNKDGRILMVYRSENSERVTESLIV